MPSKSVKKVGGKRKQNGKKSARELKQKYEMETSPKEQITELEKEIFSIKINEYENKLSRKKHLCAYLEEEIKIYKTLYNEKQLLKSESMKLLNNAFQDFATEIFLLDQELNALQYNCDRILKSQEFCSSERERVKNLCVLEEKLGSNLYEAEKYIDEVDTLNLQLLNLQKEASMRDKVFLHEKTNLIMEFEKNINSIQDRVYSTMSKIIADKSLKLSLLPEVYKILFLNGLCCGSWLESSLKHCNFIQLTNTDIIKLCNELYHSEKSLQNSLKEYFSDKAIASRLQNATLSAVKDGDVILTELKELKHSETFNYAQLSREYLHLEELSMHQEKKVERMHSEVKQLENSIKLLEDSGETCFETSYLVKIICRAGFILRQEL